MDKLLRIKQNHWLLLDNNIRATREERKTRDKFAAARQLMDMFNHQCSWLMQCGVYICFDEVRWWFVQSSIWIFFLHFWQVWMLFISSLAVRYKISSWSYELQISKTRDSVLDWTKNNWNMGELSPHNFACRLCTRIVDMGLASASTSKERKLKFVDFILIIKDMVPWSYCSV